MFVSSLLNCLATISDRNSYKPLWKPDYLELNAQKLRTQNQAIEKTLAKLDGKLIKLEVLNTKNIEKIV